MKTVACLLSLTMMLLMANQPSSAIDIGLGAQFGIRHTNSLDQYYDGGSVKLLCHLNRRLAAFIQVDHFKWSHGWERPAPSYGFEFSYDGYSLFAGMRFYLKKNPRDTRPYFFVLVGRDAMQTEFQRTTYDLTTFAATETLTDKQKENGMNIGIGLRFTLPVLPSFDLDLNASYNSPMMYGEYVQLSMGLNYTF